MRFFWGEKKNFFEDWFLSNGGEEIEKGFFVVSVLGKEKDFEKEEGFVYFEVRLFIDSE